MAYKKFILKDYLKGFIEWIIRATEKMADQDWAWRLLSI